MATPDEVSCFWPSRSVLIPLISRMLSFISLASTSSMLEMGPMGATNQEGGPSSLL